MLENFTLPELMDRGKGRYGEGKIKSKYLNIAKAVLHLAPVCLTMSHFTTASLFFEFHLHQGLLSGPEMFRAPSFLRNSAYAVLSA